MSNAMLFCRNINTYREGIIVDMMKSTGIVRKVDELGRVVIPIELRRTLGIGEKDSLEIYVDGERIILKKYEPACIFCGNADQVIHFKGKMICNECVSDIPTPVANK
jgi:transcriptional pleiotropic regulator of transition state genes